jgi:hypothetical protein
MRNASWRTASVGSTGFSAHSDFAGTPVQLQVDELRWTRVPFRCSSYTSRAIHGLSVMCLSSAKPTKARD